MPVRNSRGRHRRKGRLPQYIFKSRAYVAKRKWEEGGKVTLTMLEDVKRWIGKMSRPKSPAGEIDWVNVATEMEKDYKSMKSDKRVVKWVNEPAKDGKADLLAVLDAIETGTVEGYTLLPESKALTNSTVLPIAFLRSGQCLCAYKA
tara:strand:+ start:888 stop:1328 length:441 start_codon:yes stop_codon:yes gene_type:complete